jgi:peroxiredoxin Q/BCP
MRHALFAPVLASLALVPLAVACGGSQSDGSSAASRTAAAPGTPAVGSAAPEIMLQNQDGRVRTLSEHRGHPVLVYFYPRDATPGCTREACALRDAWDRLQANGTVVYGISTDDVASHARFHAEHNLPFDLLSDPEETAARAYGVPVRMGFAARMSFLIDAQGNVARVFPDVDPAVHADEVVAAIAALPPSS